MPAVATRVDLKSGSVYLGLRLEEGESDAPITLGTLSAVARLLRYQAVAAILSVTPHDQLDRFRPPSLGDFALPFERAHSAGPASASLYEEASLRHQARLAAFLEPKLPVVEQMSIGSIELLLDLKPLAVVGAIPVFLALVEKHFNVVLRIRVQREELRQQLLEAQAKTVEIKMRIAADACNRVGWKPGPNEFAEPRLKDAEITDDPTWLDH